MYQGNAALSDCCLWEKPAANDEWSSGRLHYNHWRYYCPKCGRYITSDLIGLNGGLNTYLYANANPLLFVDPDGLQRRPAPRISTNALAEFMLAGMEHALSNFNEVMSRAPTAIQHEVNQKNSIVNPNWHKMYVPVCVDIQCPDGGKPKMCYILPIVEPVPSFPPCVCKRWDIILKNKSEI